VPAYLRRHPTDHTHFCILSKETVGGDVIFDKGNYGDVCCKKFRICDLFASTNFMAAMVIKSRSQSDLSQSLVTTLARRFVTIWESVSFTFSCLQDSGKSLTSSFHAASMCLS
jgi:hypothetical protein